jgi:DNA-binding SARP family transcriptional activator
MPNELQIPRFAFGKNPMIEIWTIQLLGTLSARQGEHTLTRFRTHKTGALLAYLAFHADRAHPREVLSELFWPDSEDGAGLHSLRMALTSLRKQLEPPGVPVGAVLRTDRNGVQMNPVLVTTDVAAFENALKHAARASDTNRKTNLLLQAVDLYRGELLPGFYESWVLPQMLRLQEHYLHAVQELLALLEEQGEAEQALEIAMRATTIDPKHEDLRLELIHLALRIGRSEI